VACAQQSYPREHHELKTMAAEPWYLDSTGKTSECDCANLCQTCRRINFVWLLYHELTPHKLLSLGSLAEIIGKESQCAFCRLVVQSTYIDFDSDALILMRNGATSILCELANKQKGRFGDRSCSLLSIIVYFRQTPPGSALRLNDVIPSVEIHHVTENFSLHEGRRLQSPDFDPSYVRQWLHSQLASDVDAGLDGHLATELLFIDVQRRCITQLQTSKLPPYVALSYVWGGPQAHRTTKATRGRLCRRGSLAADGFELPQTIKDAMLLTEMIGLQYLWVDSLCIVQDDEELKVEQINVMDRIYNGATLTIIAAHGNNANAGLPGVWPNTRKWRQHTEIIGKLCFANRHRSPTVAGTVWNTRSWTYQELVLSRRTITFTADSAWFSTETGTEEEDSWGMFTNPRKVRQISLNLLHEISDDYSDVNFPQYALAVQHYTSRSLSYNTDILNAFTGIMNYLRPGFRGEFLFGLPSTELESALLWQPDGELMRRIDPVSGQQLFPSWSWAGWEGRVFWGLTYFVEHFGRIDWIDAQSSVPFTSKDFRGVNDEDLGSNWRKIRRAADHREYYIECPKASTQEQTTEVWDEKEAREPVMQQAFLFSHPIAPLTAESRNPPKLFLKPRSSLLTFETWMATFSVTHEIKNFLMFSVLNATQGSCDVCGLAVCPLALRDSDGHVAGAAHIPASVSSRLQFPSEYNFIMVARTRKALSNEDYSAVSDPPDDDNDAEETPAEFEDELEARDVDLAWDSFDERKYDEEKSWNLYDIMMVEWSQDIACRLGVGTCHIDAFWQAKPVWKRVILG
jgi:hypothetical protein